MLTKAEKNYWPTELEVVCLVWILKKIRHIIESTVSPAIIHTNHLATVAITQQTTLSITAINKLNLQLIRAADYIQRFSLILHHISGKLNYILDALSRLAMRTLLSETSKEGEGELDSLTSYNYKAIYVEIKDEFGDEIKNRYITDRHLKKMMESVMENDKLQENKAELSFRMHEELL